MTQNTVFGRPYSELEDPLSAYEDRKRTEALFADQRAIHPFSSVAVRNSTYAAYTAQGGAMVDGMMCSVAGYPMIWEGGTWHGIRRLAPGGGLATRQMPLSRFDGVEDSFFAATIEDPGFPYRIWAEATAYTFAAGCIVEVRVRAGNGVADNQLPVISAVPNNGNNTTGLSLTAPSRPTAVLTGPSRVIGYAVRVGTAGSWEIISASVSYQVEPA